MERHRHGAHIRGNTTQFPGTETWYSEIPNTQCVLHIPKYQIHTPKYKISTAKFIGMEHKLGETLHSSQDKTLYTLMYFFGVMMQSYGFWRYINNTYYGIVQVSGCSQMTETVRIDDTNLTNKKTDSSTCSTPSETNLTWHHVFVAPRKLRILSISTNGIELFELIFLIIV